MLVGFHVVNVLEKTETFSSTLSYSHQKMNAAIKTAITTASASLDIKTFAKTEDFLTALFDKLWPTETPARKPRARKEPEPEPLAEPTPAPAKNIEKFNTAQTKKIKQVTDDLNITNPDKKAFLAYVNAMTKEQYMTKTFDLHAHDFFVAAAVKADSTQEADVTEVDFRGKKYYVTEDKKVFEILADGNAGKMLGHLGFAEFAEMRI
jgi:hypothetical protein